MINNSNELDTNSTPKKYSKRSSAEYMRAMSSPGGSHDHEVTSPETPSPPYHGRRSSTSLGFFASPLHPRAEAVLSKNGNSGSNNNAFILPQSPSVKSRLMPPVTPKSRNAEMFLSPSPKLKSPSSYRDNGKPIREISNGLKARLNYALVKLQNGWVDKTLPELDNELTVNGKKHKNEDDGDDDEDVDAARIEYARESVRKMSSYNNEFITDSEETLDERNSSAIEDSDTSNSAHLAFLKALSSPKKKLKQEGTPHSPLQWSKPKRIVTAGKEKGKDQPSEVEAIETLMSLSSPQRSRSSNQEFSLPAPPKIPSFSASTMSPTSSSSQSSSKSQQPPTVISGASSHSIVVPIMQKQSSDSSSESLENSLHGQRDDRLHHEQQPTDIETDVEPSDND